MSKRGKQPSPRPRPGGIEAFGYEILGEPTYTYPMPPAPEGGPPQVRQSDETAPPSNPAATDPPLAEPPSTP